MKKFNLMSKKKFDSTIQKELRHAGHPNYHPLATPSMQPSLSSVKPSRKAKL